MQVARPLTEVDHSLRDILLVLAVVAAAGIALAAGLGALVARAALAPVQRFTRRTEEIAGNPDPVERIAVTGDDELARLARSFNATLDALERSVEAQRHLVADASHELRTPIASLRANIQTLEDADRLPEDERAALRADIIAELDELTALVADVVELARGSKPGRCSTTSALDRIVAALVERAEGRARRRRRRSDADLEPTVVRGEPDRVNRAVSNLLDNAVKWSPAGGVVELDARATACSPSATTAPGSRPPTCRTSSSASTAPTTPAGMPGSGPRPRDRPPGRRGARRQGRGGERPRRRRADPRPLRAADGPGSCGLTTVGSAPLLRRGETPDAQLTLTDQGERTDSR